MAQTFAAGAAVDSTLLPVTVTVVVAEAVAYCLLLAAAAAVAPQQQPVGERTAEKRMDAVAEAVEEEETT